MLHSSSCVRSVGLLAFGGTLLILVYMMLSTNRESRSHYVPVHSSRKTPLAYVTSTSSPPTSPPTPITEPPKDNGNVLVILPKDHRTKGDFGFKEGGWLELAIQNRKDYADLHGYEFIWEDLTKYKKEYDIDACWAKVAALQHSYEAYPDVEWMWMLDSDAIIMNSSVDLHQHLLSDEAIKRAARPNFEIKVPGGPKIEEDKTTVRTPSVVKPEEVYLIIAADGNGLNAGSFFIRRTPFMLAVIEFWRDPYLMHAGYGYREQDALAHLIVAHEQLLKHVAVVDQRLINEYVDRLRPGDFVVHFAGCIFYKDRDCDKLFKEHWEKADKPRERKQESVGGEQKPAETGESSDAGKSQ